MVEKCRFGNVTHIKQINDIWEGQNITVEFGRKRSCLKRSCHVTKTKGRKEVEVGTLLLGNDKNNVVVNYLLTYFLC